MGHLTTCSLMEIQCPLLITFSGKILLSRHPVCHCHRKAQTVPSEMLNERQLPEKSIMQEFFGKHEAEVDSEDSPRNATLRTHSTLCCISAARFCRQALCCTKGYRREFANTPRPILYKPRNQRTFSLFRQHRTCGWWPCLNAFFPHQTEMSFDALKKKDDDRTKEMCYVTANVKLEVELLTQRDADELPVGKKRLEPNRCPYLPAPHRSGMDDYWCTSRLKAAMSFFYHAYGRKCVIMAAFSLLVVVVLVTIYRLPEMLLKRIFIS